MPCACFGIRLCNLFSGIAASYLFGIIGPKFFGAGIESQAWGALFGAIAGSALIQIPAIYRNHLSLKPLFDFNDPGVRRVMKSLLPIVFGLASGQIIAMNLPRFFAIGLGEGSISALDNANRLMQVPIDVLASGPAIALYPTLALLAAQGQFNQLRFQLVATLAAHFSDDAARLGAAHGASRAADSGFAGTRKIRRKGHAIYCRDFALLLLWRGWTQFAATIGARLLCDGRNAHAGCGRCSGDGVFLPEQLFVGFGVSRAISQCSKRRPLC